MGISVFDGHCDTLFRILDSKGQIQLDENDGHWSIEKAKTFTHCAQFFACFGSPEDNPGRVLNRVFLDQVSMFHQRILPKYADTLAFCTTGAEMDRAWNEGKIAAFLSVEGGELLNCDQSGLYMANMMGVRAINLTWNHANELSGSNVEEPDRGLSGMGVKYVRDMNRYGILVDVSHLSDPGFWDVVKHTQSPIIASHSDSRACHDHTRNLTDDQFKAIRDLEGTVGLNLCHEFLGEPPTLDAMVRHLEHFLDLDGENTVALGGDWDGIATLPEGIHDVSGWAVFYDLLKDRGYSEELLDKIFYKNLKRVVTKVCIT